MAEPANTKQQQLGAVLVIGGCGFLGHHIVKQLVSSGQASSVGVVDVRTTRNRIEPSPDETRPAAQVQYFDGDITSLGSIRPIFDRFRPDVVIHTASPTLVGTPTDLLYRVNVQGTKNLVELAGAQGSSCRAFVYTSSPSVVSDGKNDLVNADERWPYVQEKVQEEYYAQTKAEAERFVLAANRQSRYNSLLTTSIRPASMIGEGDVQNIPSVLQAYRDKRTHFQLGSNDNLFDFTYVGNAAAAHVLAAAALTRTASMATAPLDHERVDGEAFFVTNDSPVYFWDFPRMVWRVAGDTTTLEDVWRIPTGAGLAIASVLEIVMGALGRKPNLSRQQVKYTSMTRYFNCRKAMSRLAYRPTVDLHEAITRAVRWVLEQERERERLKTDRKGQ